MGGIVKLGMKREKVGDILVSDDGADIIVKQKYQNYYQKSWKHLQDFKIVK